MSRAQDETAEFRSGQPQGAEIGGGRSSSTRRDHKRTAWALALFGLVPFVATTGLLVYAGSAFIAYQQLVLAHVGYSATILAFLGGIRWGYSLSPDHQSIGTLIASVVPSLFGWALVFVPPPYVFAGFALGFLAAGLWDWWAARSGRLPGWFGPLRLTISLVVAACQAIAFAVTF